MTLYRKYRPQKLAELDIEEVQERLSRILSSSYMSHAYLFSGPKGTGKTSAARIVAKILNCEKRNTGSDLDMGKKKGLTPHDLEPCNKCDTCISITLGQHLDVLEVDAASNRGIEEIRDLREKIKLAPTSAQYKVYIIDEAHMLTNEAFNALLKTLEEPPGHAVFILATTEPEKLPVTIISRCMKINFHKASISETVKCLNRVAAGEKLKVSEEILGHIAQSADGSFRDATKILEQAILEDALTSEKLNSLLGRESLTAEKILILLSKKEAKPVLEEVVKMVERGVNFRFLVEDILHLLHDLLLCQYNLENVKVSPEFRKTYTVKEITDLIRLFSKVFTELRGASIAYLPLEVAIVEWCDK